MHEGHYVFAQLMQHLPLTTFRRCVARYGGEHRIKRFSCLDQYLCLAFAQLTWRESLRDIEACLRAQSSKLYHLGFRSTIARNTLANANAVRDWRIYAEFAQHLIGIARRLYADDPMALELDDRLCVGFNHHRSLPLGVLLGAFPIHQGRCEAPYAARSARQYSLVHLHQRRQDA